MSQQLQAMLAALRNDVQASLGGAYARIGQIESRFNRDDRVERIMAGIAAQQQQQNQTIIELLGKLNVGGGGGAGDPTASKFSDGQLVKYIHDIPGQRIPTDLLVAIDIGANQTGRLTGTVQIPSDGPFVATSRFMALKSNYSFSVNSGGTLAQFVGRSFGRWRPVHSVMDWADAQAWNPSSGKADPGNGTAIYASPTNHSAFRTMQFDGVVEFQDSGTRVPRQNLPVPSAWYISSANEHFQLAALDFFERNTALTWYVTPNHTNNPGTGAGNVFGFDAGNPIYPAADSQYDVHEGILDAVDDQATSDPVVRNPAATLYIGFHGFQIRQPPGVTSMI